MPWLVRERRLERQPITPRQALSDPASRIGRIAGYGPCAAA
jgi:hypothetical protein